MLFGVAFISSQIDAAMTSPGSGAMTSPGSSPGPVSEAPTIEVDTAFDIDKAFDEEWARNPDLYSDRCAPQSPRHNSPSPTSAASELAVVGHAVEPGAEVEGPQTANPEHGVLAPLLQPDGSLMEDPNLEEPELHTIGHPLPLVLEFTSTEEGSVHDAAANVTTDIA